LNEEALAHWALSRQKQTIFSLNQNNKNGYKEERF
jgi:hypothetical protein